jgi:hypothetical protein
MDSTIAVAQNLRENFKDYKLEAAFFLAAAHGFKGRLFADEERKNWRKAALEGKAALKYMEECKEKEDLSPELLFGDALYNKGRVCRFGVRVGFRNRRRHQGLSCIDR